MNEPRNRTASLAIQELDSFCQGLSAAPSTAWSLPTPCTGWDVAELARHVASVAWAQGEAVHRARIGISEAPALTAVPADVADLQSVVQIARDHVAWASCSTPRRRSLAAAAAGRSAASSAPLPQSCSGRPSPARPGGPDRSRADGRAPADHRHGTSPASRLSHRPRRRTNDVDCVA